MLSSTFASSQANTSTRRWWNSFSRLLTDNFPSIAEDRSGSLWIGTWGGGLNRLAPRFVACFTKCIPA
ncbi:MAG: hypothetical protein HXY35_02965 [Chloroflexi bacterium]|nr:hypothetical protein [Chloroflexota bacterium]